MVWQEYYVIGQSVRTPLSSHIACLVGILKFHAARSLDHISPRSFYHCAIWLFCHLLITHWDGLSTNRARRSQGQEQAGQRVRRSVLVAGGAST